MRRFFWIGVGVAGTVVVLRKAARAGEQVGQVTRAISPVGIARSLAAAAEDLRSTAITMRASMAEHEANLTAALLPSEEEQQRARLRRGRPRPVASAWDDGEDAFF